MFHPDVVGVVGQMTDVSLVTGQPQLRPHSDHLVNVY